MCQAEPNGVLFPLSPAHGSHVRHMVSGVATAGLRPRRAHDVTRRDDLGRWKKITWKHVTRPILGGCVTMELCFPICKAMQGHTMWFNASACPSIIDIVCRVCKMSSTERLSKHWSKIFSGKCKRKWVQCIPSIPSRQRWRWCGRTTKTLNVPGCQVRTRQQGIYWTSLGYHTRTTSCMHDSAWRRTRCEIIKRICMESINAFSRELLNSIFILQLRRGKSLHPLAKWLETCLSLLVKK